jgi:hypothetical protein
LAQVVTRLTPIFARFSPALLLAAAVVSSGGALGAADIPVAILGEEVAKQVLVDYPISWLLDKLIGNKPSALTNDEAKQLQVSVESLAERIEQVSQQNPDVDDRLAQFATALVDSDELRHARQCVEGLDSKLNVMSGELAVRLDQIQEELAVMNRIALPKIESVLCKYDILRRPEFFRDSGPLWVDFLEGYVYARPEAAEIVNRLKEEDVVAIKGEPASGKSSILRDVGYRLSGEGAQVRFLGLRTLPVEQASDISKLRHGFILVDDAHLNLGFIENLLLNRPNAKILIACRDIDLRKLYGPTVEYKLAEYLDNAVAIKATDAAERILGRFEEKRGPISPEMRSRLTKNDLWVMAWQLRSIESRGSLDEASVLTTVKGYLENIPGCARPENILLPVSAFFEYETPVRKPFLESFEGGGEAVRLLEAQGEIVAVVSGPRDYVALRHSEVAAVYQRAFRYFDDLGASTKATIIRRFESIFGKQDSTASTLTAKLVNLYLREYPTEITNLVAVFRDEVLSSEIIRNNMDDISEGLKQQTAVARIAACLDVIGTADRRAVKTIAERLNPRKLADEIEREGSVYATGILLSSLRRADRLVARQTIERLSIRDLVERLDREEDLESIRWCLDALTRADADVAKRIAERLDVATVVRKVDNEMDTDQLGGLVGTIAWASKSIGIEILKALDVKKVVEKTAKAGSARAIRWGILTVTAADAARTATTMHERAAEALLEALHLEQLLGCIEKEPDLKEIGQCVASVARLDRNVVIKILKGLDHDKFIRKLEHGNAYDVGECLAGIHEASRSIAVEIAKSLDAVRLCGDIKNDSEVSWTRVTLNNIAKASRGVARRIVRGLIVEDLARKLDNEEDLAEAMECLFAVANLNTGVCAKVAGRLDIARLAGRIMQEEDVHCLGMGLLAIAYADPAAAQQTVEALGASGLVERIDKTGNILAIGECMGAVAMISTPTAEQTAERLDVKGISVKAGRGDDVAAIGVGLKESVKLGPKVQSLIDAMRPQGDRRLLKTSGHKE